MMDVNKHYGFAFHLRNSKLLAHFQKSEKPNLDLKHDNSFSKAISKTTTAKYKPKYFIEKRVSRAKKTPNCRLDLSATLRKL